MGSVPPGIANIGPGQRRRRFLMGVAGLGLGLVGAVALVLTGASPGWRLVLLVPFAIGMLGMMQARTGT